MAQGDSVVMMSLGGLSLDLRLVVTLIPLLCTHRLFLQALLWQSTFNKTLLHSYNAANPLNHHVQISFPFVHQQRVNVSTTHHHQVCSTNNNNVQ